MHWFQKCNFWKKSLSSFRGHWGQEVIFEVAEARLWISSRFYKFSFRIFVVLGFEVIWPQQPQRPQRGLREFFQKLRFWNQCIPRKELRHVSAFSSTFLLNLSTEEVWSKGQKTLWNCNWIIDLMKLFVGNSVSSENIYTKNSYVMTKKLLTHCNSLSQMLLYHTFTDIVYRNKQTKWD